MNPAKHIALLALVAMNPPELDVLALQGLKDAEETLRKGSKSFEIAKLAFGREMRIGLVAVYAWCRVTVSTAGNCKASADIRRTT
jgi:15-cis-phytoene synthase/lycopene beta-cyclase